MNVTKGSTRQILRRISAKILSKILPQKAHKRDIRDKSAYLG